MNMYFMRVDLHTYPQHSPSSLTIYIPQQLWSVCACYTLMSSQLRSRITEPSATLCSRVAIRSIFYRKLRSLWWSNHRSSCLPSNYRCHWAQTKYPFHRILRPATCSDGPIDKLSVTICVMDSKARPSDSIFNICHKFSCLHSIRVIYLLRVVILHKNKSRWRSSSLPTMAKILISVQKEWFTLWLSIS